MAHLRFGSPDDAWLFWVAYGGLAGFDLRKRYTNLSKYDAKKDFVLICLFQ
jgi:zinc finger SWIM domain-containing protein 3